MEQLGVKKRSNANFGNDREGTSRAHDNRHESQFKELDWLAELMDDRFRVPGTNIRFGLDSLVGLVPGIGDSVSSLVSAALVFQVWRKGVPAHVVMRMCGNIAMDFVLGSVPVAGDLFDVGWKANRRNVRLARKHLEEQQDVGTSARRG